MGRVHPLDGVKVTGPPPTLEPPHQEVRKRVYALGKSQCWWGVTWGKSISVSTRLLK
jgi:hypothetical protein